MIASHDARAEASPGGASDERLVGGRYTLEALIGRGGMGEVWRARHVALQSRVAIKFLQGAGAPSERARRRFLAEAQVTANLRTRHAVQVFDFGVSDDGRPYLVMELLEGETLDKRIARGGRLSVAATSRYLQKAARALDRAHTLGIVHRDFKPENVMLVADEEEGELVKVVDFGIAKLVGDLDATRRMALGHMAPALRHESSRGAVPLPLMEAESGGVGTPYYMAPEQVQDATDVGPAADIWAFGIVAYECLTGRRPYDDASVARLLMRVLAAAPPPPASSIAWVPPLFDDWFRVACAARPADRFADVQSAALALAAALDTPVLSGGGDAREPSLGSSSTAGDAREPSNARRSAVVPEAATTLCSREECARAAQAVDEGGLAPPPPEPEAPPALDLRLGEPFGAQGWVSPLAATLAPPPAPRAGEAPPLPEPPSPPSPAPRMCRFVPIVGAILTAALGVLLVARADPGRPPPRAMAHAVVVAPPSIPGPTEVVLDRGASRGAEPPADRAPAPVEPAVVSSSPPAEPRAAPSAAPQRPPPPRRRVEATPSAYHLPPLGL